MNTVTHEIEIRAPIDRVFDLASSVDLHVKSTEDVQEEIVGSIKRGLVRLGDEITWHGRYLGFMRTMTFRITACTPPDYFCNSMIQGPFSKLDHHYSFHAVGEVTVMTNVLCFAVPYGFVGRMFGSIVIRTHLKRFLVERGRVLRDVAEGEGWRNYLKRGRAVPAKQHSDADTK